MKNTCFSLIPDCISASKLDRVSFDCVFGGSSALFSSLLANEAIALLDGTSGRPDGGGGGGGGGGAEDSDGATYCIGGGVGI